MSIARWKREQNAHLTECVPQTKDLVWAVRMWGEGWRPEVNTQTAFKDGEVMPLGVRRYNALCLMRSESARRNAEVRH